MKKYRPDHYYLYDELTDFLTETAAAHPGFMELSSLGKTPQGRELWLVTLTDLAHGAAEDKPAYWADANLHAAEVAGSAACLYTIDYLLRNLGDESVASLLRERTLYLAPRINPDGAEYCLTTDMYVRSVRRNYPDVEDPPGLQPGDVDGDGRVLQMRVEDPMGAWRKSTKDARLLVRRRPWDTEGPFYHLYREGSFDEESAKNPTLPVAPDNKRLDFNRNYPYEWKPEDVQYGAGPFPLSEPETRAVVEFLTSHPNVCGMMTYHTYTGVLLRPFTDKADSKLPKFDLATFKAIGERCTELTGYPCISVFHDFAYDPGAPIGGTFDDWAYEQFGVHCYTMELWNPYAAAGIEIETDWMRYLLKPTEEEQIKFLDWSDAEFGDDNGFVDWHPFEHPQLGPIEIGGWLWMYSFRNPPHALLEKECHNAVMFSLDHARSGPLPQLELRSEPLGEGVHRVIATTSNTGYLPTYVTEHARAHKKLRAPHLDLHLGEGLALRMGERRSRPDHLGGYANSSEPSFGSYYFGGRTRDSLREHEWVVEGGGVLRVEWHGDRIGRKQATIEL